MIKSGPDLKESVLDESDHRVSHHPHSVPADNSMPEFGEPADTSLHPVGRGRNKDENESIGPSSNNGSEYFLP